MRILNNVQLTDFQKQALAKIVASPTPKVAGAQISAGQNMIAARDALLKLGALTFSNGEAQLTDKGQQLAQSENIVDQGGQLTDEGQQLAQADPSQDPQDAAAPSDELGAPGGVGDQLPPPGNEPQVPMNASYEYEPLELLREFLKSGKVF